jgi:uncharacterized membrane protein YdfJ with MMPL/SSD domain
MATAGRTVVASGLSIVAALRAVMLVPVPTFRLVPLGILLAVRCMTIVISSSGASAIQSR